MKDLLVELFRKMNLSVSSFDSKRYEERRTYFKHKKIFEKYKDFTMVPFLSYSDNLALVSKIAGVPGDVVECGVWRGGMMGGIAELAGKERTYWLFDSFEGLPPAGALDGELAKKWQADKTSPHYFDNCSAEQAFAVQAMKIAGNPSYHLVRGWFDDTVGKTNVDRIALLRLDGDWYESTMVCLEALYPKVENSGIIIIDDYYFWDGCARALHDFLSKHKLSDRIEQTAHGVAYIIKNKQLVRFE